MSILWTKNCELICSLLKIYVWPSFLLRFSSLATVEESISNILSTYPYQVLSVKSLHQYFRLLGDNCQYRDFRAETGLK